MSVAFLLAVLVFKLGRAYSWLPERSADHLCCLCSYTVLDRGIHSSNEVVGMGLYILPCMPYCVQYGRIPTGNVRYE
jgi:hypothetical protein